MPDYSSLNSQIEGFKSELTTLYTSGQLTGIDLLYVAKSLNEIGGMLGVNDIVNATANSVSTISSSQTTAVNAVNATKDTALAQVASLANNLNTIDVVLLMDAY